MLWLTLRNSRFASLECGNLLPITEKMHKSHGKYPGTEDQALVIPRGDLLCWKFIDLLKSQISNYKYQTISNDRNSKIQTMSRLGRFWFWIKFSLKYFLKMVKMDWSKETPNNKYGG